MAGDSVASEVPQVFQFSTDAFREHERISAWREAFGRTILNIDIAPKFPDDFHAGAKSSAAVWCRSTSRPSRPATPARPSRRWLRYRGASVCHRTFYSVILKRQE
jgi:hypothetical protein